MNTRQKILIIDDDEHIAELISLYLTKEFFQVRIVSDGARAMKEFNLLGPDLAVPGNPAEVQGAHHHSLCQGGGI